MGIPLAIQRYFLTAVDRPTIIVVSSFKPTEGTGILPFFSLSKIDRFRRDHQLHSDHNSAKNRFLTQKLRDWIN